MESLLIYLDDILIYTSFMEEHDNILCEVLICLQNEGITLNKSVIGVQPLSFLGHSVSSDGIKIDPDRVEATMKFPDPSNKKE